MQSVDGICKHYWRILATGISFTVFGLGGLGMGLLAMPMLLLLSREPEQRRLRAQYLIHRALKAFIGLMQVLGVMRLQVHGAEKLQADVPQLVLANHPSLLDVVCLISIMPQADCIVKQALWRNPFTRGPVQAAAYILNDQSEQLLHDSVARLHGHNKMIVFPEGTRTAKNTVLNPFQRGAAHIALASNAEILPVIIRCTPSTLSKNEAWYHVPPRRFVITVDFQDGIDVATWREAAVAPSVQVRRLNAFLHEYFLGKLAHERFTH